MKLISAVFEGLTKFYNTVIQGIKKLNQPKPYYYWLLQYRPDNLFKSEPFLVVRDVTEPYVPFYKLIDGPFETQEDVVRAKAFWELQSQKPKSNVQSSK